MKAAMIVPATLKEIMAADPTADTQAAIVDTLDGLLKGVSVVGHPGKVDIAELVGKTVVKAPGVGIGWSRIRPAMLADGSYSASVEWTAYIVVEATVVDNKRVEKERIGFAIGGQLLKILADPMVATWGRQGLLPPEATPAPELKPLFTVRDQSQGTAYYTVSWTQQVVDIGAGIFPQPIGAVGIEDGAIEYAEGASIQSMAPWLPAGVVDDA